MIAEADDKANPGVGGAPVSSIVEDQKAPHVAGAPVEAAPGRANWRGCLFWSCPTTVREPRCQVSGLRTNPSRCRKV